MTKAEFKEAFIKADDFRKDGLIGAIIFYYSPIDEEVNYRVIYSPNYQEALIWLNDACEFYNRVKFEYKAFIHGNFHDAIGEISHYLKEE